MNAVGLIPKVESSGSEEIDDVLNSHISLVIGSFKFALWRTDGVWILEDAAVSERTVSERTAQAPKPDLAAALKDLMDREVALKDEVAAVLDLPDGAKAQQVHL